MPSHPQEAARHLAGLSGPRYWRGLEELLESDDFRDYLRREFPDDADKWTDPVSRRQFLLLMGASLALAGVSGCSVTPAPRDRILPYVRQPEAIVPGKPLYFATAMPLGGDAIGFLVESHEGRPTKIEGNPQHPASLGATDVLSQASILGLYDPDRSQSVTYRGQPRGWDEAVAALRGTMDRLQSTHGAGVRILTGGLSSPTLISQLRELLGPDQSPAAKWIQYEPLDTGAAREGARLAFGEAVQTTYDLSEADVILALDADFLHCGSAGVRYSRQFSDRRRVRTKDKPLAEAAMCRLYAVEPMLTNTGAAADHRLALRASQIEHFARALARELGVAEAPQPGDLPELARRWVGPLAADLRDEKRRGRCPVIVGERQPARVHALVHAINEKLGNAGRSVVHADAITAAPAEELVALRELVAEMRAGKVDVLIMLGTNPVYTAPADLDFAAALARVRLRIHHGLYQDETAVRCDWHVPEAHYLESWSDCRTFDGTASIVQPLIEPLYGGRSAHEVVAVLTNAADRLGHEIVRNHWRSVWRERGDSGDFESFWQAALQAGTIPGTALPRRTMRVRPDWAERARGAPVDEKARQFVQEIVFAPDSALYDGRFANNGWLQELPRPITRLTWGNAAIVSPRTAQLLGVRPPTPGPHGGEHGEAEVDVVELRLIGQPVLKVPVWVQPGHADGSITLHLGHGRTHAGHTGNGVGINAYALRTSAAPWIIAGTTITVRKVDERQVLACVQMHHRMHGRRPVRGGTLDDYQHQGDFVARVTAEEVEPPVEEHEDHHEGPKDRRLVPLDLYAGNTPPDNKGHRWGMVIDLTACTGCSACVVACQAENNIPVVGKEEVVRGREMHWIRIDRYFEGDADDASDLQTHFQPVPCMHCERAPCELVCPVNATVHSADGLNDMVYNRCVGTRYCSNNCPYKVRRFNFLHYADFQTPSLKMLRNPEVTVRSRGVMEKCTYCVQRIRQADIAEQERLTPLLADLETRRRRGDISEDDAKAQEKALRHQHRITERDLVTACQAACPARAIVFGDLDDPESRVRQWHDEPLDYALLDGLNTKPRTTYLAALRNPNPKMP